MMRNLLICFADQALEQGLKQRTGTKQRDKSTISKYQLQYKRQDVCQGWVKKGRLWKGKVDPNTVHTGGKD